MNQGVSIPWRRTITLAALLLAATVPSVQAAPLAGVNAGAPISSGTIVFTNAMAADIASSGCQAIRLNFRLDGNSSWTAGLLANYDTIIQTARSNNLQILGLLANEAIYATQSQWNENYNTTGLNAVTTAFANNAWLLINRYKNDIKLFEIWNEPDCWSVDPNSNPLNPGGFYIWPKNYANILAETYKKCIVSGGANFFTTNQVSLSTGGLFAHDIGGSFSTSRTYFTSVYTQTSIWNAFEIVAGRRYPWNYFGYHFYLDQGGAISTTKLANYFNDIRTMKTIYNDATPFLVTEFGWQSAIGDALQAANLRNTYNWFRTQADIVTAYWYQWNNNDGGYGLVYSIGNHKPSYTEFAAQCLTPSVAQFQGSPLNGLAPLTVQFTDQSTGTVQSRSWTFGDGGTSTLTNPAHIYANSGTYTVSLTVSNTNGSNTITKTGYIVVGIPGDTDGDGDVDMSDFGLIQACMTDPNVPQDAPACLKARLDADTDVDIDDVMLFIKCLSGPGIPARYNCAN